MADQHPIITTKVGPIFTGDRFHYHRQRGTPKSGWLTARSADINGRWVNGVDDNSRLRAIDPTHITIIRRPEFATKHGRGKA